MPVNSGVSENVESFSNFQHGREICLNQKSSQKRGSAEKSRIQFSGICILPVVCVSLYKIDSKAVVVHSMNKTNLADFV